MYNRAGSRRHMRICHITSHLPPDQAANSLLPFHLGQWALEAGDEPVYLAHTPRAEGVQSLPGPVTWFPRRRPEHFLTRVTKLGSLFRSAAIVRKINSVVASADLVHVHSNGLLPKLGALVASWTGKPFVFTLYGTEIWHYCPRRVGPDLFTRAYRHAAYVTFYSHCLADRAIELGLDRANTEVVYPSTTDAFSTRDTEQRRLARLSLGLGRRHVVLNVKRLHPLGGQRYAIEALPDVVSVHPDTQFVFCGSGPLKEELEAIARRLGVDDHVTFAGLVANDTIAQYYAAADVFVLPSILESFAMVAVEALACGTPVVSSDTPGGIELKGLFGPDVVVVPRKEPRALAGAVNDLLAAKRRTNESTANIIERKFRSHVSASRFQSIYRRALGH